MHPQIPDFQIVISGPNTVLSEKNASMESLFVQLSDDIYISILKKLTLMIGLWSRVTFIEYYIILKRVNVTRFIYQPFIVNHYLTGSHFTQRLTEIKPGLIL